MLIHKTDGGETGLYINESLVGKRHLFQADDLENAARESEVVETPPLHDLAPRTMGTAALPICGHGPAESYGPFDPVDDVDALGEDVCERCRRSAESRQRED